MEAKNVRIIMSPIALTLSFEIKRYFEQRIRFAVLTNIVVSFDCDFCFPPHISLISSYPPNFLSTTVKVDFGDIISIHVKVKRKANRGFWVFSCEL